ncbi:GH1 family beta-glucosidase [Thermostaphylospora chromogena]|uniref:Beta-glucosidase n=1 Tax=Thermostaphylospora chromogena TaxID=35622 RepID=A0A1H1GMK7_9ACTN|nr:GH1 family beta-glucosidase [Thermostaphylospora chromogena]SDR14377.1 broad-specificity cellobiase [Thermostaphylospora chromogena]
MNTNPRFPGDFLWGAATSAYQIEGAVSEDGRGPSVWDVFSHTPGKVRGGDTGDVATDHYHRLEDDLDLMASLGLRGYRFSVSWSRVMPEGTGPVNQRGLDFYRRLVDGLHARGIRPTATLFHWDLPQALQDKGGWENRDCASWFADYARVVFDALDVADWCTINEPKTVVEAGYQLGIHAPGVTDPARSYVVLHHLNLAHGLAVRALRAGHPGRRIGPALNLAPVYPADDSERAAEQARLHDGLENRLYLDPIFKGRYPSDVLERVAATHRLTEHVLDGDLETVSEPIDFLGVQYYHSKFVDGDGNRVFKYPVAQAEWLEIYPDGLYDLLVRLSRELPDTPLVITENGMASPDAPAADGRIHDTDRIDYLRGHIAAMGRAMAEGAKVTGYHAWSLLDNFEWAEGYEQRFGLVYVDFATLERVPKDSALWYRDLIAGGRLP